MSTESNDKLTWANHWQQIEPAMRQQRVEELRSMTIAQRQQHIENLLDLGAKFAKPRRDNGLVIWQQRLQEIFGK